MGCRCGEIQRLRGEITTIRNAQAHMQLAGNTVQHMGSKAGDIHFKAQTAASLSKYFATMLPMQQAPRGRESIQNRIGTKLQADKQEREERLRCLEEEDRSFHEEERRRREAEERAAAERAAEEQAAAERALAEENTTRYSRRR